MRSSSAIASKPSTLLALLVFCLTVSGSGMLSAAESVVLEPVLDNTLYETPMDTELQQFEFSNGEGWFLFMGLTGLDAGFRIRRTVLKFDIAGALPAGAQILTASLMLYQSRAAPGAPPAEFGMYRALQEWGEGASDAIGAEGQGTPALAGDATWHHRIWPDVPWDTAGGHFVAEASSVTTIGTNLGDYVWPCTGPLLDDLRLWQQDPAQNFGWVILGSEEFGQSAHRFNSRQHPTPELRPRLTVRYLPDSEILSRHGFESTCDEE